MNVKEGMRRLGILLGACGGIAGGCLAYGDARVTWEQHMAHRKFEALMSSPTLRKIAKAKRDDYVKTVSGDSTQPGKGTTLPTRSKFGGVPVDEVASAGRKPRFSGALVDDEPSIPSFEEFKADQAARTKPDPWAKLAKEMANSKEVNPWALGETIPVLVNLDGIKQVTVDEVGVISSIDLSTGQSVPRADPPPLKAYLIPLLYPVLGFLLPWGGIRLITWVGSGFVG